MYVFLNLVIVVSAIIGLSTACHIYLKKKEERPFVCPLQFDCHAVTQSKYSKLFGIGLEWYGIAYYAAILASYILFLIIPEIKTLWYQYLVLLASIGAFVFSLFLTFVQAVKLKQWCSWCLVSAFMSTIIFFAALRMVFVFF